MDSIDYYDRYAVPYYEETVNLSMEEQLQSFMELLPENGEVLDLGCGSEETPCFSRKKVSVLRPWMVQRECVNSPKFIQEGMFCIFV